MSAWDSTHLKWLLHDLCVKLGFCLSPEAQATLLADPPDSVEDFSIALFEAEGLDPVLAERQLVRRVVEEVALARARSGRAGTG